MHIASKKNKSLINTYVMKKIFAIITTALLILCIAPSANAQLLKKLGDAAKSAAENAVSSAVSKIPGKKQNTKPETSATAESNTKDTKAKVPALFGANQNEIVTTHGTYPEGTDPFLEFVDNLGSTATFDRYENNFPEVEKIQEKNFTSISEAAKAYPMLPSSEQLVNQDPAPAKDFMEFSGTATKFAGYYTNLSVSAIKIEANANSKLKKATPAQMAQVQGTAMEMYNLMLKNGIDPEKMSEAELMEFMKQKAASGELKLPEGLSASDIVVEEEASEHDILSSKIDDFSDRVEKALMKKTAEMGISGISESLKSLYTEIQTSWKDSDAYKKVYDIEKDIDQRTLEYFKNHPDYGNNGAVLVYPPFWVEGRKNENAIINDFNMANAGKWLNYLQTELNSYLPLLEEMAELDSEIDEKFPNKEESDNLILKCNLSNAFMNLSTLVNSVLDKSYVMPLVSGVTESDQIAQ